MKKQNLPAFAAGIGMLILIMDTKTAVSAVIEGLNLCLETLIPSLFPFIFLSSILSPSIIGKHIPGLTAIGRIMGIPAGCESLFLIGLLGGYPVGAQCIAQASREGSISREIGARMMAFCSNAGPSFLFGMGTRLFPDTWMCWALWVIHIASAIAVSLIVPNQKVTPAKKVRASNAPIAIVLKKSIQTMATVCGWVILFRVLLTFCQRWFLWLLPGHLTVLFTGILELANGCYDLKEIADIRLRFILFSGMLGFGGLCVAMQTFSVCDELDCRWYIPGKILQSIISIILSYFLISREITVPFCIIVLAITVRMCMIHRRNRNNDSIPQKSDV